MNQKSRFLSPSEAATRLNVSTKALRLYEQRGLVTPLRTEAGWRTYGPDELARAGEIAALRALGLSLADVARVLDGQPDSLEPALAAHQTVLEQRIQLLSMTIDEVRKLRSALIGGQRPVAGQLARLIAPSNGPAISFELPWPWGGEIFELTNIGPLNFIVGPLGSGKTRLAQKIAETMPGAAFVGPERIEAGAAKVQALLEADAELTLRVERVLKWLEGEGATMSGALLALVATIESDGASALVIDMVEEGLDAPSQEAIGAWLRHRSADAKPLFLLTRSSSILDLAAATNGETIILCPANHSPPSRVAPFPGTIGFEAVATCLATPDVRARTHGTIAFRPKVA